MKYVYTVLFLLIVTLTTLFVFQNSGAVQVSLLFNQIILPMSVLIVLIYFLGMLTGGILLTLMNKLIRKVITKTDNKTDSKNAANGR
ncbi:LapA family protein [Yersinia nurmii]|uniref:LapA family protein n=1 Tax=Yersinia nurmii TaxID=685706 RepID=A0AAW7K6V7_9GAMM|nr:LapA family protein [Yersinia nurmii]MDN0089275.1 LapA family protein [Yersinia nurmii]CNE74010.1 Uncharacterized integral membrane protein [Yersinia nurmii]